MLSKRTTYTVVDSSNKNRNFVTNISHVNQFFLIQVDDNGEIVDAKFKTFGCGSAIASSSLATEWIKGRNVNVFNDYFS